MNEKELSSAKAEIEKPSYWAVLPAAVRYDPTITAGARLLYAEISSLTDARGYCWASNAYFERLYDLSERTIVRLIRALENAGYIRILDAGGGSARSKIAAVNQKLTERGIDPEKLKTVHTPIGVNIRAVTPAEIAVSILGELILCRAEIREGEKPEHHACPMH